jgi:hypothetical protein
VPVAEGPDRLYKAIREALLLLMADPAAPATIDRELKVVKEYTTERHALNGNRVVNGNLGGRDVPG